MTTPIQPGQHPDADQLNAFAEHALPLDEQQATLAHLATCAGCRAIVYLAQPPAPEPTAHPQPARTRTPLFARRKLSFPMLAFPAAAAALACLILLTIHFRNAAAPNQIPATNTAHIDQTPPPPPPAPPTSNPAQIATPQARPAPSPHASGSSLPSASTREAPPRAGLGLAPSPAPAIATPANPPLEDKKVAPDAVAGIGYSAAPAAAAPASPLIPSAAPQLPAVARAAARELRSSASQYDAPHAQAQQAPSVATGSVASNGKPGIYGGTGQTNLNENYIAAVPLSNAAVQTASAATSQTVTVANAPSTVDTLDAATLHAKVLPQLPSKLPALSVVSNARRQLALDTAGALFRSDDAGVTWQPVPIQWTGRAVSVALLPSPSLHFYAKSLGGLTAPPAAAKSSAAPPTTFQLTTDAGDLWISPDGQTWKRK
jgi:hypothetical protein